MISVGKWPGIALYAPSQVCYVSKESQKAMLLVLKGNEFKLKYRGNCHEHTHVCELVMS